MTEAQAILLLESSDNIRQILSFVSGQLCAFLLAFALARTGL